jgi:cyclopropane fatty-acyl-phospholipid synthase-like methyltransferase
MLRIGGIDSGKAFDFGKTAEEYAKYRDIYPDSFFAEIFSYGIGLPGQKVLDLGTGSGVVPRSMVKYGAEWTGADISEEQIAQAVKLSRAAGADISYTVCPADDIPFGDDCFDAVTACQCFWYFPKETSMPEIKRVLRPGGRFAAVYMIHLPLESAIVKKSDELVEKYNPSWSGGGFARQKLSRPPWLGNDFKVTELREYVEDVEFTLEGWCGRMRSCRGVGASIPREAADRFREELYTVIGEMAGDCFAIPHQFIYEVYDVVK